jgi:hypothetical protein
MELKNLVRAKPENLPDWLLEPSLQLTIFKMAGRADCSEGCKEKDPTCKWDGKIKARQVCFYKKRKLHARKYNPGLPLEYHSDSSDDSNESDSDDSNESDYEDYQQIQCEPLEQLVIHHQGPLFTKRVAAESAYNQKFAVAFAEKCLERAGIAPNVIQDVLKPNRQIDVFVVHDTYKKIQVDPLLENIKSQFFNFGFHSSQYQVCMELLKGRNPASNEKRRNDVFFSAPCGCGKSLCFVVSAYALGGVTVSVYSK